MVNNLEPREHDFLLRIVVEFITLGGPISSRHLSKLDGVDLSSASIRNIMLNLSEKGYLSQPHSSSGRVPTDAGYRLYVESLSRNSIEFNDIKHQFLAANSFNPEFVIKEALHSLSDELKFTCIATSPNPDGLELKSMEFIQLSENRVLSIVITMNGLVLNRMFKESFEYPQNFLTSLGQKMSAKFSGHPISEVRTQSMNFLSSDELTSTDKLYISALNIVKNSLTLEDDYQLHIFGRMYITNWAFFENLEELNTVYREVEEGRQIKKILSNNISESSVYFKIGQELNISSFNNCALVAANYGVKNCNWGSVCVLGPKRIDYQKIANSVLATTKLISKSLI